MTQVTSQTLLDLAERVEKATGPDRELDALIAVATKVGCHPNLPDDLEHLSAIRGDEYEAGFRHTGHYWFHCRSGTSMRRAEDYTSSLDAAISLVGPEDSWRVGHDGEGPDPADFRADVIAFRAHGSSYHHAVAVGANAALALTAACLRARAAQGDEM